MDEIVILKLIGEHNDTFNALKRNDSDMDQNSADLIAAILMLVQEIREIKVTLEGKPTDGS